MKIVISYRWADSDVIAGRIRDRLAAHYGDDAVFMDVNSIPFGRDFRQYIQEALAQSDVLIAIVGLQWLGQDERGFSRIDDEADPVRIEVEAALQKGIAILPLLIGSSKMPSIVQLPDSLKPFAFINAAPVDTGRDFHLHMERIIGTLDKTVRASQSGSASLVNEPDGAPIGPSTAALAETAVPPADQPSIAVLPFNCFSEDREFKFLTEAMTEDLITMLARIPGFIVIARQSSFAYQGRSVDCRRIGRELGVRYIIEGSLRPVAGQIRVSTQLIDATTGAQLWAGRFDGQAENVLDLQDQIVRAIAGRIEPELVRAEIALIRRRHDANPNAWSCYRQGTGVISLEGWSEETLTRATALLRQATALDPDFALAHAQLALLLALGARLGLITDTAASVMEARVEAERAVTIDQDASEILGYAGCALADLGDVQRGSEILERAIENDPSNAQAWVALGASQCYREHMGDVGLEKLRHGMRLSPRDHRLGFWGTFYALALARHQRLTEAQEEAQAACRRDPQFYVARVVLALIAAGLGKREAAIAALREAQRRRPRLSLEEIKLLVGRGAALLAPLWREVSKSSQRPPLGSNRRR